MKNRVAVALGRAGGAKAFRKCAHVGSCSYSSRTVRCSCAVNIHRLIRITCDTNITMTQSTIVSRSGKASKRAHAATGRSRNVCTIVIRHSVGIASGRRVDIYQSMCIEVVCVVCSHICDAQQRLVNVKMPENTPLRTELTQIHFAVDVLAARLVRFYAHRG